MALISAACEILWNMEALIPEGMLFLEITVDTLFMYHLVQGFIEAVSHTGFTSCLSKELPRGMRKEKKCENLGAADWLRYCCSPYKSSWVTVSSLGSLFQNHWHRGMSPKTVQLKTEVSFLPQVSFFLYRKGIKNHFVDASSVCESDCCLLRHGKMKEVLTVRLVYLGNCSVQGYACMWVGHFPGLLASCWKVFFILFCQWTSLNTFYLIFTLHGNSLQNTKLRKQNFCIIILVK